MFTLYKMRIVPTNHDNINSKWHQYKLNRSCTIHISELSTKAKCKRTCFQGSSPYYTLQLAQILKVSIDSRNKRNEKERGT